MKLSKSFVLRSQDMRTFYREDQIWRVRWPLFLQNHFRQFTCRHCWATRAVCAEPRASR